jgi:hypothetical protein
MNDYERGFDDAIALYPANHEERRAQRRGNNRDIQLDESFLNRSPQWRYNCQGWWRDLRPDEIREAHRRGWRIEFRTTTRGTITIEASVSHPERRSHRITGIVTTREYLDGLAEADGWLAREVFGG